MLLARLKYPLSLIVGSLLILSSCLPAAAGAFNVKPIRVFLSKDAGSTILTIENQASSVLRLQVRAFAWTNDRRGQPVLTPSDDLIVFPTLLDLNPLEHRSIRIGFSGNAASKELTYRVALDELPSLESQIARIKQPGLEVRTRITVPVFFTPLITNEKAQIDEITVRRGMVQTTFSNTGNVHATVSNAEVIARDSGGKKLVDTRVNGWYVLAGESWQFQTSVAPYCGRVKSVSVTIQSDIGRFTKTSDASAAGCR